MTAPEAVDFYAPKGGRYPPSRELISGHFLRRNRNQLFHVFRMLSRGVR